jgi:LuxR family maltose regulon positive regulatory protein
VPKTDGAPPAGGLDLASVLLAGKLHVPRWRQGSISRRRLIDRARASRSRVVSVAAPAGYGKSTLLAEWAELEHRNVAWVSLDLVDDDPAAFLSVLAAACVSLSPAVAGIVADMRSAGTSALGRAAPRLAQALAAAPSSFVLFVDDLHWADSAACQDALEVLLSRVPEGSQVVVATRREPPLLARLRATDGAWQIAIGDLSLDHGAARTIFDQAGVAGVDDRDLEVIVTRCEGWPAGLYLCALMAKDGGDAASITGDDRFVSDYLYRECVARLPDDTQMFLRRTAVLGQFSAESCDALLDADDSHARLGGIENANLFLVAIDRGRRWFRYHALFREFLLTELERAEGATAVAQLHRRAADWHEQQGAPAVAVEHLLRAGETERAVRLVRELSLPMYQAGRVTIVRRWLDELGDEVVRSYPPLVVLMTWATVLLGEVANGLRWTRVLAQIDPYGRSAAERNLFEASRRLVLAAICAEGHQRMVADAAFALEHEPITSAWRGSVLHLWASACLLVDDREGARAALTDGVAVATTVGNPNTVALCEPELALLAIDDGRWLDAAEHARRGVDAAEESRLDGYATTALALAVGARIAFHFGDRERGRRLLSAGMRARVNCTYLLAFLSVRVRLQLAEAHLAMGEAAGARHLLRETDEILRRRPDVGVLNRQVEDLRGRLVSTPSAGGSVPLTPAELRLLPYLQTHLTIQEIGQRLYVSRNTVSSQLGSIYRKFAVTTRGAAVERASSLGLLG